MVGPLTLRVSYETVIFGGKIFCSIQIRNKKEPPIWKIDFRFAVALGFYSRSNFTSSHWILHRKIGWICKGYYCKITMTCNGHEDFTMIASHKTFFSFQTWIWIGGSVGQLGSSMGPLDFVSKNRSM